MRQQFLAGLLLAGGIWMSGCGVSASAGRVAQREIALLATMPAEGDLATVRGALSEQAGAWEELSSTLYGRVIGGIPVSDDFVASIQEIAALARRQKELIDAGEDEEATDREVLERMKKLWAEAAAYLGE